MRMKPCPNSEEEGPGVLTGLVSMSQMEVINGAQWPSWIVALFLYCIWIMFTFLLSSRPEYSGCCHCFENERGREIGRKRGKCFFPFVSSVELGGRPVNWLFN